MKKVIISVCLCMAILLCLASCDTPTGGGDTTEATGMTTETPSESISETVGETESESTSATVEESNTEDETEEETGDMAEGTKKRLYSDSGTQLNLVVEYHVEEGEDGKPILHADVMLESYSLSVTARNNTQNFIRVGEETQYFATDAIDYDGKEQKNFKLGSFSFVLERGVQKAEIEAVWSFGGTYNDTAISKLIIEDEIEIGEQGTK